MMMEIVKLEQGEKIDQNFWVNFHSELRATNFYFSWYRYKTKSQLFQFFQ